MKDTELKQLRDSELYKAYKQAIREHTFNTFPEACAWVAANSPASQFYIEASTAAALFGRLAKGDTLDSLNEGNKRRIFRLVELYHEYRQQHPDDMRSRLDILQILVLEPAPEFYLSASRVRKILLRERRNEKQRRTRQ